MLFEMQQVGGNVVINLSIISHHTETEDASLFAAYRRLCVS